MITTDYFLGKEIESFQAKDKRLAHERLFPRFLLEDNTVMKTIECG